MAYAGWIKSALMGAALSLGVTAAAEALTIDATVTADNYYRVYVGNYDGTGLVEVLRTSNDSCGQTWTCPETASFNLAPGQTIYVAVWNIEGGNAEGWAGQFFLSDGRKFYSDSNGTWELVVTGVPSPQDNDDGGLIGSLVGEIDQANMLGRWKSVSGNDYISLFNYPNVYDPLANPHLDPEAIFLTSFYDQIDASEACEDGFECHVALYRLAVPEPATLGLIGVGLVGLAFARRRRR